MVTCEIKSKIVGWKLAKVESKSSRPTDIQFVMSPERPVELPCDIKKVKIAGEAWTLFVGLLNGKPYEVFGGLSKYVEIPNKFKSGKIVKVKKSNSSAYNLVIGEGEDQLLFKNISDVFENANHGAFTRMISLSLRHGIPIQYIVEQLNKDAYSDITSFSKVLSRVLKSYVKDGTAASGQKGCPECGETGSLVYESGCLTCKNCNFSKCG
jgi:ribonucleoside-diphosphate reductase alpha chain